MLDQIILTSLDPKIEDAFSGYFFSGGDLVLGKCGFDAFRSATGKIVTSGEDGCYVFVRREIDRIVVGNDFCGHKKLFLYSRGDNWAISTSFHRIIAHVREHGWPASFRPYHRELSVLKGSIFAQLPSHRTAIDEIMLCPRHSEVVIAGGRPGIVSGTGEDGASGAEYGDLLAKALSVWAGRIRTIDSAGIHQNVALSGGVDSRAVSSFYIEALRTDGVNAVFRSAPTERHRQDLKIAMKISRKYGFPLNSPGRKHRVRSGQQSVDLWRDTCLGSYYPVRLPEEHSMASPVSVSVGGGGGELHRDFYGFRDLSEIQKFTRKRFSSPRLARMCFEDISESIRSSCPEDMKDVRFHYSEFRSRMHSGVIPNQRIHVLPVASKSFVNCSRLATDEMNARGQLIYDVMCNLVPGIERIKYDDAEKMPGPDILANITRVSFQPVAGTVFGRPEIRSEFPNDPAGAELLAGEFERATGNVRDLFAEEVLDQARSLLGKMSEESGEAKGDTRIIHQVLFLNELTGVVDSLDTVEGRPGAGPRHHSLADALSKSLKFAKGFFR